MLPFFSLYKQASANNGEKLLALFQGPRFCCCWQWHKFLLSSQMSGPLRLSHYCCTTSCSLLDFHSAKGNQTKPKSWVICYTARRLHSQVNPSAGTQPFESRDPAGIQTSHQGPPEVSHREFKWTKRLLIHKQPSYRYLLCWKNKYIFIGAFVPGAVAAGAVMPAGQHSLLIPPHCPPQCMLRERECWWYGPPEGHIKPLRWSRDAGLQSTVMAEVEGTCSAAAPGSGTAGAGSASPGWVSALAGRWQHQGSPCAWGGCAEPLVHTPWAQHRGSRAQGSCSAWPGPARDPASPLGPQGSL